MPAHHVKWYSSAMPGAPVVTNGPGTLISALNWCLETGSATTAVQSIVVSGGVATVTFPSAHTFQKHQVIEIGGVTGALTALNDQWRVTGTNSLTLTFAAPGVANGTAAGTMTCKTPGLGWQKAFSGTNKAAYRSQDVTGTRFYCRVDDSGASGSALFRLVGYETMSGIDDGQSPYPPPSALSGGYYGFKALDAGNRPWIVAGDSKSCYVAIGHSNSFSFTFGFGDFVPSVSSDLWPAFIGGAISDTSGVSGPLRDVGTSIAYTYCPRSPSSVQTPVGLRPSRPLVDAASPSPGTGEAVYFRDGKLLYDAAGRVRGSLRGIRESLHATLPYAAGRILDSADGYDGLLLLLPPNGDAFTASGVHLCGIDLVGPWQ